MVYKWYVNKIPSIEIPYELLIWSKIDPSLLIFHTSHSESVKEPGIFL